MSITSSTFLFFAVAGGIFGPEADGTGGVAAIAPADPVVDFWTWGISLLAFLALPVV